MISYESSLVYLSLYLCVLVLAFATLSMNYSYPLTQTSLQWYPGRANRNGYWTSQERRTIDGGVQSISDTRWRWNTASIVKYKQPKPFITIKFSLSHSPAKQSAFYSNKKRKQKHNTKEIENKKKESHSNATSFMGGGIVSKNQCLLLASVYACV